MRTTKSCGKVRYDDRVDALIALASCHRSDSSRRRQGSRNEGRAYFHDTCGGWHLTSAPARGGAS